MISPENWMQALPESRVRTPAIVQMESSECGAASLAIILAYYGRVIPLAQLRRECGVSRDGSKASNILAAGRAHGLRAEGFRKELSRLKDVLCPYILFWNFNHFLVVEGYRKGRVYLNDPGCGRRKVTQEEFAEAYTGVVLALEPGPDFRQTARKASVALGLRERLKGSEAALAICISAGILLAIPGVIYALLLQMFVDRVLIGPYRDWAAPIVAGILITAVLQVAAGQIQRGMLRRLRRRLSTVLSSGFVWHLLHLPFSYYAQRLADELSGRVELNGTVADVLSERLVRALTDALVIVLSVAVMTRFDPVLSGMAVLFACCQFVLLWMVAKRLSDGKRQVAHLSGKTWGIALSGLQSIRTIKASGLESDFFERWAGHFAKLMSARQEIDFSNEAFAALPALLSDGMTLLVLAAGGFRVMDGALTVGQLVAVALLMSGVLRRGARLVSLGPAIQTLKMDLARLDDVLENPPAEALSPPAAPRCRPGSSRLTGRVELCNVSFGYNHVAAPPLIEGLSLIIEPGQRVALVGASGSGKSTVARLVAGLHQPAKGEILFDGYPRAAIPREVLTSSLALVEQDISLFEGTFLENLTLWNTAIPPDAVAGACRDALIEDLILAMPRGYHSELMEGAANLSGGQRQQLELARALVSNPSILVLDEATSALDAETEYRIDRNLRRRGCSCLIAAHRLATIADCQEIIVLDRGRVVERGRHHELIRAQGQYARLLAQESSREVAA